MLHPLRPLFGLGLRRRRLERSSPNALSAGGLCKLGSQLPLLRKPSKPATIYLALTVLLQPETRASDTDGACLRATNCELLAASAPQIILAVAPTGGSARLWHSPLAHFLGLVQAGA